MFNKIKLILKYVSSPAHLMKAIRNPAKILVLFRKDLIFEPIDFVFQITREEKTRIKKYLDEIREDREFNDYIWKRYNAFEKELVEGEKDNTAGGASREMAMILYAVIRLLKPENVLETGVANGISSAYILEALRKNQKGKLISIDLPYEVDKDYPADYMAKEGKTFIPQNKASGWLIPEELKNRWQLILGRSSEKLPEVLEQILSVDVFLHDSEHSYRNMLWEYETVWPFLREKGLLLSHDVNWNKAFDDFCTKIGRKGIKYRQEFGGIRK